jgi:putative FmdB family regulatory protein
MPTYEFECPDHGRFDLFRLMKDSDCAGDCPVCGIASARVVTAPNIRLMAGTVRSAMDRNEKSRHAPHVCGAGCNHSHVPNVKSRNGKPKLESYRGPRPWVVEHR